MRIVLLVVGIVAALMGTVWALQGDYLLPATFMRGNEWIAIGSVVAAAGVGLVVLAYRLPARGAKETGQGTVKPSP